MRRVLLGEIHFTQIDNCTAIRLAAPTLARAMGDPETGVCVWKNYLSTGRILFRLARRNCPISPDRVLGALLASPRSLGAVETCHRQQRPEVAHFQSL